MDTNISWVMITRYFAGECLPEEQKIIEDWIESDPLNSEKIESLRKIWDESGKRPQKWDAHSALVKVNSKISATTEQDIQLPVKGQQTRPHHYRPSVQFYRVAASIAFLIIAATVALYMGGVFNKSPKVSAWSEKATIAGQKSIITLYDGTTITLNAGSKLKYPKSFQGDTREVYLEGEAYFEVAHNPDKPFIVHSGKFTTIDLGTAFNIKAFSDENDFKVSLISGKVSVSKSDSKRDDGAIILRPDEQYSYNKITGAEKVGEFNYLQVTGWKDNILVFHADKLSNVFKKLERAYGIKFELKTKSFTNYSVTANFRNASFLTILQAIKRLTGLDYRTETSNNIITEVIYYKK